MKFLKRIIGYLGTILLLNLLVNWIFVGKNDGQNYVDDYINSSKSIKVHVDDKFFEGKFTHTSYFKYAIFFKGIFGGSQDEIFKDSSSGKYYRIMRFDRYGDQFSHPQTSRIKNEELYVQVDPVQYDDPSYGTLDNPILVFSYKGVSKKITYFSYEKDSNGNQIKDENGESIPIDVSLEPSEEEYRYNVKQYLTYVMPKEEFKCTTGL